MEFKTQIESKGKLKLSLYNIDTKELVKEFTDNLVTNEGLDHYANQVSGVDLDDRVSHMAIGTGTGQTATDQILAAEVVRSALGDRRQGQTNQNTVIYEAYFSAGQGTGNITEAGLFNANTGGVMVCYSDFTALDKQVNMALSVVWTVTFS